MNDEPQRKRVLGPEEIRRALTRIAHEILESGHGPDDLVLLGIPHRGVPLAERLGEQVLRAEGVDADAEALTALVGSVDITLYRDDLRGNPTRVPGPTRIPPGGDRKSTRLNSSHVATSYAVLCLKKPTLRPYSDVP